MNAVTPATQFKVANVFAGERRDEVSKQWMSRPYDERFLSLADLKASVDKRRQTSVEYRAENRKIELIAPEPTDKDSLHRLGVGLPDGREVAMSHWSFGQTCGLAGAPASYLRDLPSQLVADNLNYGLRYNRKAEAIKVYAGEDQLRAVTGPDYGRIFDAEVVDAVMQVAGNGTGDTRWKVPGRIDWQTGMYNPEHAITMDSTTLYASDRDVFAFLVDDRNPVEVGKTKDGDPDLMFRGFYITNSEVGAGSLKLAAFYLRAVCQNRMLWGVENFHEITMRHTRLAPSRFMEEARPALRSFADGSSARLVEAVGMAKNAKVAENDEDALNFLLARKLSKGVAAKVIEAVKTEEGRNPRTAWDMMQGVTAVARSIPHVDQRTDMEALAGVIGKRFAPVTA